ncbi:hypothetical protein J6590_049972 [Homalodisca vitripennis]|nr:hypothetical protein J6590_049972 [Homalodisca vitripennis]
MFHYNQNILHEALLYQFPDRKYIMRGDFDKSIAVTTDICQTYYDNIQCSNENFKNNVIRNVKDCNGHIADMLENIFEGLKNKSSRIKETLKKNVFQKVHDGNDFAIGFFEDLLDSMREKIFIVKCYVLQKVCCSSEFTIDAFENFIMSIKKKNMYMRSFFGFEDDIKTKLENDFEDLLDSWKDCLEDMKDRVNLLQSKLNEKREIIIDEFDDVTDCFKTVKNKQMGRVECAKEEIIDSIEDLIEKCKSRINYFEENIKTYLNDKKDSISDEFEDIFNDLRNNINRNINFVQCIAVEKKDDIIDGVDDLVENTKWALKDRKSTLLLDAECAFDDAVGRVEVIVNEGRDEIKNEMCHLRHRILMIESLFREFLSYSEHFMSELFGFSEQRMICFLCEGKHKAKGTLL